MLPDFGRCQNFCVKGGDKALVPAKAEAKAGRYALFFRIVDESGRRQVRCLTDIWSEAGRINENAGKILQTA